MAFRPPPHIDIDDRDTWIQPVSTNRIKEMGAYRCRIEYDVPVSPATLSMAMHQLPSYIPRSYVTLVRLFPTISSKMSSDNIFKSGFAVEVVWPLGDI